MTPGEGCLISRWDGVRQGSEGGGNAVGIDRPQDVNEFVNSSVGMVCQTSYLPNLIPTKLYTCQT